MRHLLRAILAVTALAACAPLHAQDYPTRPVRVLVPYTPGGITDLVTRITAGELAKTFGQTFVVDNRPGANSILAVDMVSKATPDGYTLGTVIAAHAANQTLYAKLPYDSVKSFEHVSLLVTSPLIVCVTNSLPAASIKDLIELAKAKSGQLTFASSGIGAAAHLTTELFMSTTGIKMTHVPYKGTAPALQDLIGGQINFMMDTPMPAMLPQVRAGKVKALGMASDKRISIAQEIPTLIESGVQVVGGTWVALLAPAGTPKPIVDKLSAAVGTAMRRPDLKERFAQFGMEPVGSTSAEFTVFLKNEVAKWAKVIKDSNVKID
ncbi:MAG TPA: tripartite tricarboxylate transporter substrate binding protein [Burkholderiales bacterium]|nr:tripartite tricarboxylate transporter substrate binding protein [Burkholderiales bacterium]